MDMIVGPTMIASVLISHLTTIVDYFATIDAKVKTDLTKAYNRYLLLSLIHISEPTRPY